MIRTLPCFTSRPPHPKSAPKGKSHALRGAIGANSKRREKQLADALKVDFTKPRKGKK